MGVITALVEVECDIYFIDLFEVMEILNRDCMKHVRY
jgi:hypothetical protein